MSRTYQHLKYALSPIPFDGLTQIKNAQNLGADFVHLKAFS